jgi:hypothetical protein
MKFLPIARFPAFALTLAGLAHAGPKPVAPPVPLPGDTSECYAYYSDENRCLATRGDINARTQGWLPDSLPSDPAARQALLETVKASAVANLTEELFLADQARQAPVHGDLEGDIQREHSKWASEWKGSVPDSSLRRLYDRYADALFRFQPGARLEILASTDSAFLDTIWTAIRETRKPGPWLPASLPLADSPEDLYGRAKAAVPGQWQAPLRTRFGFVSWRLVKKGKQAMPNLAEAAPALAALARRPSPPAEVTDAQVREYYAAHRKEFLRPDTLRLEATLRPRILRKAVIGEVAPRMVELSDLPRETLQDLHSVSALRPGDTLGPLENTWGHWRFRVTERRRGRDTIPAAEASLRIRGDLARQAEEGALRSAQDLVASKWSGKERSLTRNALESAYAPSEGRLDSLARSADPKTLSQYGSDAKGAALFREFEGRRLAQVTVDSLHREWIRSHIRISQNRSAP